MILNIDRPAYNTIIVFSIVMILLCVMKPTIIYDYKKNEYRQFGMTGNKTLLPIHVIGLSSAIIIYVFFAHLHKKKNKNTELTQTIQRQIIDQIVQQVNFQLKQ